MISESYKNVIVNYYDRCQIDYEWVWHLKKRMAMHYGYWDETTPRLRHALTNMNKQVAAFAGVQEGEHVLDAGCGVGGSSIYLAQNFNCKTIGISLSERQVDLCKANASRHDVADQCRFDAQSYLATTFPDNTFDVVWAIESVCYAPDKASFLREAFRVLKPGGRVIVADFYENAIPKAGPPAVLMNKMAKSWAIESFADRQEFWNQMSDAGFVECRQKDVSPFVARTVTKLYRRFFLGLPITLALQLVGYRNWTQFSNVMSAYYQYHAFKKGFWKYMFYSGTKPRA